MQNSYKLARTRRHAVGMSCGSRNISQNSNKYRINSYRIARVYLYFVMNIVDMSYGTRRTVLTKTLVTQLVDICGDMWQVITRAYSSHIVGKLVTVGQGLYKQKMSKILSSTFIIFRHLKVVIISKFCNLTYLNISK